MMIFDQDIRRSVWLIVRRWGVDAAAFAAIRADALLEADDLEESAVWRSIAKEIEKLQIEKPAPGEGAVGQPSPTEPAQLRLLSGSRNNSSSALASSRFRQGITIWRACSRTPPVAIAAKCSCPFTTR
jgi:hypothetical protein